MIVCWASWKRKQILWQRPEDEYEKDEVGILVEYLRGPGNNPCRIKSSVRANSDDATDVCLSLGIWDYGVVYLPRKVASCRYRFVRGGITLRNSVRGRQLYSNRTTAIDAG
jgi:hypothetical protein